MKKIYIHIRAIIKFLLLLSIGLIVIGGLVGFVYKPIYSVTFKGEHVGYVESKSSLQEKINNYMKVGDGELVAFVDIEEQPQYSMCMLKKDILTNEDEILEKVIETGVTYYKYYAVTEGDEEKFYVTTKEDAESAIEQLKEKKSTNKDKLGIVQKYETELKEFASVDKIVSELYVKPVVVVAKTPTYSSTAGVNLSDAKVSLGMSLTTPVYGIITSRFGYRTRGLHTGVDVGTQTGTTIVAAAGGVVTTASYSGGYGNLVVISHGNGVQTFYAHCNTILVSVGDEVSQGQAIATVGSTGNSTGPHLHLEIRKNGVSQNPQNYLY